MFESLQFDRRTRWVLFSGVAIIAAILLFELVITPLAEKRDRLQRKLRYQEQALLDLQRLAEEYRQIKRRSESAGEWLGRRSKGFTLFSFLDDLAGKTGIKDHITYMKPSVNLSQEGPYRVSSVETKLQGITLKQLVAFLYRIETSSERVSVKRLAVTKPRRHTELIDVVLQVQTLVA